MPNQSVPIPILVRVDVSVREVQILRSDEQLHERDQLGLPSIHRTDYDSAAVTV